MRFGNFLELFFSLFFMKFISQISVVGTANRDGAVRSSSRQAMLIQTFKHHRQLRHQLCDIQRRPNNSALHLSRSKSLPGCHCDQPCSSACWCPLEQTECLSHSTFCSSSTDVGVRSMNCRRSDGLKATKKEAQSMRPFFMPETPSPCRSELAREGRQR